MAVNLQGQIIDEEGVPIGGQVNIETGSFITPPSPPSSINSSNLYQTPETQFQSPQNTPLYPVGSLDSTFTLTAPEVKVQSGIDQLQDLNKALVGESTFRTEQEQAQGITELQKTQSDLSSRLKALQNEALAIPLQLQQQAAGKLVSEGGLRPIQTAALRNNAIQALATSSLLEASRGNLNTALNLVDRAVAQRFDPIKEQVSALQKNLDLIIQSPEYTQADKRRAQQQKDIQDARAAAVARQEANYKKILDISTEAAQSGADPQTLQRLQSARTPQEALQIAGFYLGAEFRNKLEQRQFENDLQVAQYNLSVDKFYEDMRQFDEQMALQKQKEDLAKVKASIEQKESEGKLAEAALEKQEVLTGKIRLIDSLISSRGLRGSVGPYKVSRFTPLSIDKAARQEFVGGVHQLIQKETIDTLINLKERGGTLGALSDQERILLQEAATKIGTWEIKDKKGFGTGRFSVSENAFKKELKTIRTLAVKALEKATGRFSKSENTELDAFFGSTQSSTTTNFNPASFYGI